MNTDETQICLFVLVLLLVLLLEIVAWFDYDYEDEEDFHSLTMRRRMITFPANGNETPDKLGRFDPPARRGSRRVRR
jgi:hypothetical protein